MTDGFWTPYEDLAPEDRELLMRGPEDEDDEPEGSDVEIPGPWTL